MSFIYKIKLICTSLVLSTYYFFCSFLSKTNLKDGNSELIVSLTSYGFRLNFVFLTIECLLQQCYKPKKIYLWLHKDEKVKAIPKWILSRQEARGLIIKFVSDDVRSYKKLSFVYLYNISDFDFVVTADDDVLYPKDWLSGFAYNYKKNPMSVYCYRGRKIVFNTNNETNIASYKNWPLADNENCSGNFLIPTGVSGVCYPINSLDYRVFDFENIKKHCPFADDIWYKLITTSNFYVSKLVCARSIHFTPVITGFSKGLEKFNIQEDGNTVQFSKSILFFNLKKQSFE